jgi:hypothetical protein
LHESHIKKTEYKKKTNKTQSGRIIFCKKYMITIKHLSAQKELFQSVIEICVFQPNWRIALPTSFA